MVIISEHNKRRWYLDVVSNHASDVYSTLLSDRDLTSSNLKEIEFDRRDEFGRHENYVEYRGYFARKGRKKYFLDEQAFAKLPIKVTDKYEELLFKEDIIIHPTEFRSFNISPEPKIDVRSLVDGFAPFSSTNKDLWTLMKIMSFASFVARTYYCVSTNPAFGKSSVFDLLHYITDKCPVFKPRSIPGVLNKISGNGNMVLDETHRCEKKVRDIIEEFSLQIGGGKSVYINGALKAANTKDQYDCSLQSITFLYNNVDCYDDPDRSYFEFIFSNNKALDDRFLKFCFNAVLDDKFDEKFDLDKESSENKMYYIDFAKTLLHLQGLHKRNGYKRRFKDNHSIDLPQRKRKTLDAITWLLDIYCFNQTEYDHLSYLLVKGILDYREMIKPLISPKNENKDGLFKGGVL